MNMSAMNDGGAIGRWRLATWVGAGTLILMPLAVLKLVDDASWELSDLPFALLLVGFLGLAFEVAVWASRKRAYAAGVTFALAAGLLQVWANLAVGVIGNEDNPANLIFFAVVAVALAGSLIARFQPDGMARAMVAAAIAQALAFVIALVAGWGFIGPITTFLVGLWLLSAWLFRHAARVSGPHEAYP